MVVLSAGILSLLRKTEGADLSRPAEIPGRDHPGMVGNIISESVGEIISERRAASPGVGR
jgi:hypothetical protein